LFKIVKIRYKIQIKDIKKHNLAQCFGVVCLGQLEVWQARVRTPILRFRHNGGKYGLKSLLTSYNFNVGI
jgi:hypothetical protein